MIVAVFSLYLRSVVFLFVVQAPVSDDRTSEPIAHLASKGITDIDFSSYTLVLRIESAIGKTAKYCETKSAQTELS